MILPGGTWVLLVLFVHLIQHRPVPPAKEASSLLQYSGEAKESEEMECGDWHAEEEAEEFEKKQ